jgi:hypothetical protein
MPNLENFWSWKQAYGIALESNEFNVSHERCQTKGIKSAAVLKFPET